MIPDYDAQKIRARLTVWWVVWGALLTGLMFAYLFLAQGKPLPPVSAANPLQGLVGVVPLFVSIVIRWLVLPRATDANRAFAGFIVGLALADACGYLGIFLGGPYRDSLFVLGVLGVTQFVPLYARKLFEPKPQGFIPNN